MLEDPLLRFWFRFVFPSTSRIVQIGPAAAFRDLVQPEVDSYFGSCFERLCREALPDLYRREGVQADYEVGEYWDRDVQIDVVGLRSDNWTDLGECKWGKVRSAKQLEKDLAARASRYPNQRNATLGFRLFTRLNVGARALAVAEPDDSRIRWHTLEELYGLR